MTYQHFAAAWPSITDEAGFAEVFPVVLGSGKRLFRDGTGSTAVRLVDTKTFDSGVAVLTYERSG